MHVFTKDVTAQHKALDVQMSEPSETHTWANMFSALDKLLTCLFSHYNCSSFSFISKISISRREHVLPKYVTESFPSDKLFLSTDSQTLCFYHREQSWEVSFITGLLCEQKRKTSLFSQLSLRFTETHRNYHHLWFACAYSCLCFQNFHLHVPFWKTKSWPLSIASVKYSWLNAGAIQFAHHPPRLIRLPRLLLWEFHFLLPQR